jgi:hypothetical protein
MSVLIQMAATCYSTFILENNYEEKQKIVCVIKRQLMLCLNRYLFTYLLS